MSPMGGTNSEANDYFARETEREAEREGDAGHGTTVRANDNHCQSGMYARVRTPRPAAPPLMIATILQLWCLTNRAE